MMQSCMYNNAEGNKLRIEEVHITKNTKHLSNDMVAPCYEDV